MQVFVLIFFAFIMSGSCLLVLFGDCPFRLWWLIRTIFSFLIFPLYISRTGIDKKEISFCFIFFILLCFPAGIFTSWIEGIPWFSWISAEIALYLLSLQTWMIFYKKSDLFWEKYFSVAVAILTFPIFIYYLYFEIYHCRVDWIIYLTPVGILSENEFQIYRMLPVFYPMCYQFLAGFMQKQLNLKESNIGRIKQ